MVDELTHRVSWGLIRAACGYCAAAKAIQSDVMRSAMSDNTALFAAAADFYQSTVRPAAHPSDNTRFMDRLNSDPVELARLCSVASEQARITSLCVGASSSADGAHMKLSYAWSIIGMAVAIVLRSAGLMSGHFTESDADEQINMLLQEITAQVRGNRPADRSLDPEIDGRIYMETAFATACRWLGINAAIQGHGEES